MTVASSTSRSGPYAGNGSTTVFAFNFKVQQAADIKVVRTVTANGFQTDTTLTSGADYTVSLNADQSASPGGSITMTVAPTTGQQITILRNVTATQGTALPNQGGWYPKVVENALDKLTMLVQQLYEEVSRSLKVSAADTITNLQDLLAAIGLAKSDAEASASAAAGSATTATTAEATATAQANSATASAALAQDWAVKTDNPVSGGEYSAKYWAQQAQASVTGNLIYRGTWDASGGSYPPAPVKGDFYKVSVSGTVGGIAYSTNDDIIYNGAGWDRIDNQQKVYSIPVAALSVR